MNVSQNAGLGEPEPFGKNDLFQPPAGKQKIGLEKYKMAGERSSRLRITTDVTKQALETIQELQYHHRVKTGKYLPAWKIISAAVEQYGKDKKGKNAENC